MNATNSWTVEVSFEENPETTEAEAVLDLGGRRFGGWGRSRRNPTDADVRQIGDELAAARALADLSHKLLEQAVAAIESIEGQQVRVHS